MWRYRVCSRPRLRQSTSVSRTRLCVIGRSAVTFRSCGCRTVGASGSIAAISIELLTLGKSASPADGIESPREEAHRWDN